MFLNPPEAVPPTPVHGKIVFRENGPWCQKVGHEGVALMMVLVLL